MDNRIAELQSFLNHSHSMFHAQQWLSDALDQAGYTCLEERSQWSLTPGGKYYFTRGNSAVVAFRLPESTPAGFLISASHTDRPCFKVKENSELSGTYTRLAVERYGGLLLFPWTDRPLSVAGRVMVETESGAETRLIDIDRDLMLIPNVAIHMNRQANDGYKWNPAVDLLPLMGSKESHGKFQSLLEEAAGGKILGHDLYLYVRENARVWGLNEEYLSAAALDDLQCVWGCLRGFLDAKPGASIPVFCALNSEEVGSRTLSGADSPILEDVLTRICQSQSWDLSRLLSQSFLVSADNAQAIHPNHPEYADPANAPVMGNGVVLKFNANQSYCTDALAAAIFRSVCKKAYVNVQTYCNRADLPGGSTLGNLSISHVAIPTADIGLPQLAMHSCYETAAVSDSENLADVMTAYYASTLARSEAGFRLT